MHLVAITIRDLIICLLVHSKNRLGPKAQSRRLHIPRVPTRLSTYVTAGTPYVSKISSDDFRTFNVGVNRRMLYL